MHHNAKKGHKIGIQVEGICYCFCLEYIKMLALKNRDKTIKKVYVN